MKYAIKINHPNEYIEAKEILLQNDFNYDENWEKECLKGYWIDGDMHIIIKDYFFAIHNHTDNSELIYSNILDFLNK